MNNAEARRRLGGMPTGENNLADMSFSVRRVEPVEEEPSTVQDLEYVLCMPGETKCGIYNRGQFPITRFE